jgi:hypothetical protein
MSVFGVILVFMVHDDHANVTPSSSTSATVVPIPFIVLLRCNFCSSASLRFASLPRVYSPNLPSFSTTT